MSSSTGADLPTTEDRPLLIFDTSPLAHMARANLLGILKILTSEYKVVIPDVVVGELRELASGDSRVEAVIHVDWIEHRELRTTDEIINFGYFSALLVRNNRNRGEAGVLALAKTTGGAVVIDDAAGRKAAKTHGIELLPTLRLLCEGVRRGLLTAEFVSAIADELLISQYRLPFASGGFVKWAVEHGLLDSQKGSPEFP